MASNQITWLNVLRRYLVFMAVGNLIWEFAHMPLYTLWMTGTPREIVFAALHCTAGDILIALSALTASFSSSERSNGPDRAIGGWPCQP
ncbi:hypothetical protein [Fodinicurvata halophila]|uniref:hypothetical protein n=1 Tax=Fodinicurvata halophila TaxID=1419723 RepID=UPI0036352DD7